MGIHDKKNTSVSLGSCIIQRQKCRWTLPSTGTRDANVPGLFVSISPLCCPMPFSSISSESLFLFWTSANSTYYSTCRTLATKIFRFTSFLIPNPLGRGSLVYCIVGMYPVYSSEISGPNLHCSTRCARAWRWLCYVCQVKGQFLEIDKRVERIDSVVIELCQHRQTNLSFHNVRIYCITTNAQGASISLALISKVFLVSLDSHEPLANKLFYSNLH
jgi:hypothetical protein